MDFPTSSFRLALVCVLAGLLLGSCASPNLQRPGTETQLRLTTVNSPKVTVWSVKLANRGGRWFLSGHVFRRYPAADDDTSRTHLAVTLFDAGGQQLLEIPAEFEPRRIPHGYRGRGYSGFIVPLDKLPESTNCIQIRVYDDPPSSLPPAGLRIPG